MFIANRRFLLLGAVAALAPALPQLATVSTAQVAEDAKPEPKKPALDAAELEKRFEESMRDISMIGYFTASDAPEGKLMEDRYVIEKVVKDTGDHWTFHARIQYGKRDMPVRIKVPVKWAGDTPVISVTKLSIPLLGTFNARVVIHEGQYAGTWNGAGHGGLMFGRIEKNAKKDDGKKADGNKEDDKPKDDAKKEKPGQSSDAKPPQDPPK